VPVRWGSGRRVRFLALLPVFAVAGCSASALTDLLNALIPGHRYTLSEHPYGDAPRQRLDLYLPKRREPSRGTVVFVYGGAWRGGRKADYEFVAHALTGLGYAVVIPDYRLFPEVRFPEIVEDVAAAIAFVAQSELIATFEDGFVLMGHSSGAHTAALIALDPMWLDATGTDASPIAFVGLAGPYDLPLDNEEVAPVFEGAAPGRVKAVELVGPDAPPALLAHGADDARVAPRHSERLARAYRDAGRPVELHVEAGADHVGIVGALAAPLRFLNGGYAVLEDFLAGIGRADDPPQADGP